MGEGWSDYFALTFHNVLVDNDKTVVGGLGHQESQRDPQVFVQQLVSRRIQRTGDRTLYRRPTRLGEIWCVTLTKATRDLAASLNDKPRACAIAWQSVVDGLKVTAANPSFLDARGAIVDAIEDLHAGGLITEDEHRKTRQAFWKAFAHFEMGNNATSQGASLIGIVGDDTLPPEVAAEIEV